MRILFICQTSQTGNDATPNLAKRLAGELAQNGQQVLLLDIATCTDTPQKVVRYSADSKAERLLHSITGGGHGKGKRLCKTVAQLVCHPCAAYAAVRLVLLHRPLMQTAYRKQIEKIYAAQPFDAAVAFCAPHTTAAALAQARIPAAKYACMFDPYSLMPFYAASFHCKNEIKIYQKMRHIFTTPQMLQRVNGTHLQGFYNIMSVLPFPGICQKPPLAKPAFLQGNYKNLVFVGNVYAQIRNPQPLLDLFCALETPQYRLVLVGGGWQEFAPGFLQQYRAQLGERLLVTGTVPASEAFAAMQHADVLADIGNQNDNQMPSKTFDYISAGRPVLQVMQSKNDNAAVLYRQYPLYLGINAAEVLCPQTKVQAEKFLAGAAAQSVPFAAVQAAFAAYTPSAAAQTLLEKLQQTQ